MFCSMNVFSFDAYDFPLGWYSMKPSTPKPRRRSWMGGVRGWLAEWLAVAGWLVGAVIHEDNHHLHLLLHGRSAFDSFGALGHACLCLGRLRQLAGHGELHSFAAPVGELWLLWQGSSLTAWPRASHVWLRIVSCLLACLPTSLPACLPASQPANMLGVPLKIGDVTPGAGDPGALAFAVEMPVEQLLGRVGLDTNCRIVEVQSGHGDVVHIRLCVMAAPQAEKLCPHDEHGQARRAANRLCRHAARTRPGALHVLPQRSWRTAAQPAS